MKTNAARIRLALAIVATLLLAAGCASTPEGKSLQANASLTFAHNAFQAAARNGELDDRAVVSIGSALEIAGKALDRYDAAVDAGASKLELADYLSTVEDALDVIEANLPALLAKDLKAKRKNTG